LLPSIENSKIARVVNEIFIFFFFVHVHFVVDFFKFLSYFQVVENGNIYNILGTARHEALLDYFSIPFIEVETFLL